MFRRVGQRVVGCVCFLSASVGWVQVGSVCGRAQSMWVGGVGVEWSRGGSEGVAVGRSWRLGIG